MVDVIIPVYRPDETFRQVLEQLSKQSIPPNRIIVVNTEQSFWNEELAYGISNVEIYHIKKQDFDHGATRRYAAELSNADYMMFLTQDALPADDKLIEALLEMQKKVQAAGVYGRQLPRWDSNPVEAYTRSFNYPDTSFVRTKNDIAQLGIRAYFFSDVCALYKKEDYLELGGFVERTIFNEDMLFAAKALQNGKKIAYASNAKVYHSHNYNNLQYFKRNFDLGVSQAEHPEVFELVSSEKEGVKLVKQTIHHLLKIKKGYYIVKLVSNSGFKFLGYKLGKNYKKLPKWLIKKITSNPDYWERTKGIDYEKNYSDRV